MSSKISASLLRATNYCLPDEVWWNIAKKLDAESLLALEDSGVIRKIFLESRGFARTVKLSPHSDAEILVRFLNRIDPSKVKFLCVANCLLIHPLQLLECVTLLDKLVELDCVNCRLSPGHLFTVIAQSLPALKRLRWSIFDAPRENVLDNLAQCRHVRSLLHMYVEICGGTYGYSILSMMLVICVNLDHLHIHAMEGHHIGVFHFCELFIDASMKLKTFTFTSEFTSANTQWCGHLVAPVCALRRLDFRTTASVCGNMVYPRLPDKTSTCVYVADMVGWEALQIHGDQVTLCLRNSLDALAQLTEVTQRPWWSQFQNLTLALLPGSGTTQECVIHYITTAYIKPLQLLFASSTNLVQLNLSFCHFVHQLDWSSLFPSRSVLRIRALALPQCALKTAASVEQLAISCPMLENFDVYPGSIWSSDYPRCSSCHSSFIAFNQDSVQMLCEITRLQRLTLCDVFELGSLDFLSNCHLVELRLSWQATKTVGSTPQCIARWLGTNRYLRFLTLRPRNMNLKELCAALSNVDLRSLETMCIISSTPVRPVSVQEMLANILTKQILLNTLHVHFCDELRVKKTVTWTSRRLLCQAPQNEQFSNGALLYNAPCPRTCSFSTFIGLTKRQN